MTDVTAPKAEALRRLRERLGHLCELIAAEPDNDEWGEVLIQEVSYFAEEGPALYVHYVECLDAAAVRAELDRELDQILAAEGDET